MKKMFFATVALCCLAVGSAHAQITMHKSEVAEKAVIKPVPFDSLSNIRCAFRNKGKYADYMRYVGQQIYFLPKSSKGKTRSGRIPPQFDGYVNIFWHEPRIVDAGAERCYTNVYAAVSDGERIYTPASAIEGKYFVIMDVRLGKKMTVAERSGAGLNSVMSYEKEKIESDSDSNHAYNLVVWTLQPVEGGEPFDIVVEYTAGYWYEDCRGGSFFDMEMPASMLVAYYVKMQNDCVGKNFIAGRRFDDMFDIQTGEPVSVEAGSVWKCTELSLMELSDIFAKPHFILSNGRNSIRFLCRYSANDSVFPGAFISEEKKAEEERRERLSWEAREAERRAAEERRRESERKFRADCIKEYGAHYGALIADGKVVVGMTKQMCIMAWGSPCHVNETVTSGVRHEQWVYSLSNYLYFDNDKLTAIQTGY